MSFYVSVDHYGSKVLYRGYDNNGKLVQEKVPFSPKLYLPSQKPTGYKTMGGKNVRPIQFENRHEMSNWVKQADETSGLSYYGCDRVVLQFLQEKFPDEINFNQAMLNVVNLDIEVYSDDGFPEADEAKHPITAITAKSSKQGRYHVWGCGDYKVSETIHKDLHIHYHKCETEKDLLASFLMWWRGDSVHSPGYPDIVTGWNVRLFDIPYILNRICKVFQSEEIARKFSPWNLLRTKKINFKNQNMDAYEIQGINQLDYYDLFKKFAYSYGAQESYSLNHIAYVVLGEKKISYEEYGNLRNLYTENFQLYIDYNIKDVELVQKIDDKLDLIGLACTIAYKAGVNFTDIFGTTSIWDSIVYRELTKKNIVIPPLADRASRQDMNVHFAGGYVKEVKADMYEWIVSFDLNSLYPNIIAQWNMSPETLVASGENVSRAANGILFDNTNEGVFPTLVKNYYEERSIVKKQMLAAQSKYQKNPSRELEREIATYQNKQWAIKILMNSLFGAIGNKWYRYFDLRIAEGITLTGQHVIKWCEKTINDELNKVLETDKDYVIAIDTDSVYVNFKPFVEKFKPKDPVKFLDEACQNHFNKVFEKSMADLFKDMNCYENRMEMGREVIADRGIWVAKKRYLLNVHNSEGVQYSEPKLKIMGIEAIKSSTPEVVRDKFKEIFKIIISGSESATQDFIQEFKQEFCKLPPEAVAFPRGVNDIGKWYDKKMTYQKGCPIHVRGALLYNKFLKEKKLLNKYEVIRDGDKIKFTYLRLPNTLRENVVAFPSGLPKEMNLYQYVDYEKQFEKTFMEPLKFILDAMGWSAEEQMTLDAFFG